ncbi:MAG TPA: hypothetical protein EYQ86_05690 [Bacteroidetes bacterium]|nr:hypothetical protein [Bacteroidota bacterium]
MFITKTQLRKIIKENLKLEILDTVRQGAKVLGVDASIERDPDEVKKMVAASSQDAYELYDAMKGVGTDEKAITDILTKRAENLKLLSQEFGKLIKFLGEEDDLATWLLDDEMEAESKTVKYAILGNWRLAKDFEPSNAIHQEIYKHEAAVPYVYDDGGTTGKEYAKKLYGKIIDSNEIQKVVKAWPVGRIQTPVTDMKSLKRYATIGVGHLIENESELKEFEQYILKNIITDDKGEPINQDETDLSSQLMSKEEIWDLFQEDVKEHTGWKDDVTEKITQSMFDAMTSIAFNSGWENNRPIYHIIRLINNQKYKAAASAIKTLATTSKGEEVDALVARRKSESEKFGEEGLAVV